MIHKIKRTVIAVSILSSGFAAAGTMGPIEAPSWTGFYAGLNAGGIWGESQVYWDATSIPPTTETNIVTFNADLQRETVTTLSSSGFTGGGQIGYNYQMNNMLLGIEGDFNYVNFDASRHFVSPPSSRAPRIFTQNTSVDWLSTVRGRLGYVTNNWLIYGTGGLAITAVNFNDHLENGSVLFPEQGININKTQTGWTAGAGAEWVFAPNWSAKVEYKYVGFGNKNTSSTVALFDGTMATSRVITYNHDFSANLVTVGVNRKFG